MNLGSLKVIWGQTRTTVQMFLFTALKLCSCTFWVRYFQTSRHELVTGHHLSRILDSEMFPKICVYYWLNFNYVIVWYVMTYLSIISEPALYSKIYVAYEIKRRCIIKYQDLTELHKIVWLKLKLEKALTKYPWRSKIKSLARGWEMKIQLIFK